MTIYEFVNLCYDPGALKIEIYDPASGNIIFYGFADEIPKELEYQEVSSFDIPIKEGTLTINV